MKLIFAILTCGIYTQVYAGVGDDLGRHLDAKYDCAWGDQQEGGSLRVYEAHEDKRAKVFVEKHFLQGDYVKTETGWYEGPFSSVSRGTYIIGHGNRLLLEKNSKGTIHFQQLGVLNQSCKWSEIGNR